MNKRNPNSPWNPTVPAEITPDEYEVHVVAWLRASGDTLANFTVKHLDHLTGNGGDYEFDAVAEFTVFQGARMVVLVECKRLSRPVEREELLALWAKTQDVGAHKAIVFATCGFQSGALDYARARGIATVTFAPGTFLYETRGLGPTPPPPPWANLPPFAGVLVVKDGTTISCSTIHLQQLDPLRRWLREPVPDA